MQFRDLKKQYEVLKKDIDKEISEVINSTSFILGTKEQELETKLAEYVGKKYCIGVGNGTDALELALIVMGVGKNDAVFVPDFTYIASAATICRVGATPVFVDIEEDTFNISPKDLVKRIKKVKGENKLNPKAIISVDLFGQPANYEELNIIANEYNLKIVEDAAQGFGGNINGKLACSFGDIACTSFFPAKPLGCYGDGGAIFTDDEKLDARLRSLRAGGKSPEDKYDNREIGMNSRLDTLQAAILIPKLKAFIEYELKDVNKVANWYTEKLNCCVVIPKIKQGYYSSWAQYTILLKDETERAKVQSKLKENNIPSMIYYPRGMHQQYCFKDMKLTDDDYPVTSNVRKRCLSLPLDPYKAKEEIDLICNIIKGELI